MKIPNNKPTLILIIIAGYVLIHFPLIIIITLVGGEYSTDLVYFIFMESISLAYVGIVIYLGFIKPKPIATK